MLNHEILMIKELVSYLKIAEKTTYRFVFEGRIPGLKVGGPRMFRKNEIDRWISKQKRRQQWLT